MLLLRRLIRNKQNTVMTNAQILDILQSEFNISVKSSHELEVDIYIKIIKKYLKDWPQWEELERISTKLNNIKDFEAVTNVLNHKYKNLKEYLGAMLEAAKPLAKKAVKAIKTPENIDSGDVVMEIQCTKEQLNRLIYRRPRLDLNNTVFNMSYIPPSRISLKKLSFEQILTGWCIKLTIDLQQFYFEREFRYNLRHVLVNKARSERFSDIALPMALQSLQREQASRTSKEYTVDMIINTFNEIVTLCIAQSYTIQPTIESIFEFLSSELRDMFDKDTSYKLPATYRKFANKYKYVRYLYTENDQNDDPKYDLQLQETVTPMYVVNFKKFMPLLEIPNITEWLKFECTFCKMNLPIIMPDIKSTLESHFNEVHQNEVDWQCTHCDMVFSIEYLANNEWYHEC